MVQKLRHMLIVLLIILKKPQPTWEESSCTCSAFIPCDKLPMTPCCNCKELGLTSVPKDIPQTTTVLFLGYNMIKSFPQTLPKAIHHLDLQGNLLTSIQPGALSKLPNLSTLKLMFNRINNIKPGTFSDHDILRAVHLEYNKIKELPSGAFTNLPKLLKLKFSYNLICSIQPDAFFNLPMLIFLDLSFNRITSIQPTTFTDLPWLAHFLLLGNHISFLPGPAYDMLSAIHKREVHRRVIRIDKNPWRCDCLMRPFRMLMTGTASFENQITCDKPVKFFQQKLKDISPENLVCNDKEITKSPFEIHTSFSSSPVPIYSLFDNRESDAKTTAHPIDLNIHTSFLSPAVLTASSFENAENKAKPTTNTVDSTSATQPHVNEFGNRYNNDTPKCPHYHWFLKNNAGSKTHHAHVTMAPLTTFAPLAITSDSPHESAHSFPLPALIAFVWAPVACIVLMCSIITIKYKKRARNRHSGQNSKYNVTNIHTTATVMTSRHDQIGQGQSQVLTETNTNTIAAELNGQDHQYEDMEDQSNQKGEGQYQAIKKPYTQTTANVKMSGHSQTEQGHYLTSTQNSDAINSIYRASSSDSKSMYSGVQSPPNSLTSTGAGPRKPAESPSRTNPPNDKPPPVPPHGL